MLLTRIALALLVASFAPMVCAAEATVSTLAGGQLHGKVTQWNVQVVTVETADGPQQVLTDELLRIRWADGERFSQPRLELVDGTRVGCASFSVVDKIATVGVRLTGGSQSLPRAMIRRVDFPPRIDGVDALWREIEQKENAGDVLVIKKGGQEGQPPKLDYLTGVIQQVDTETVDFMWDGEPIPVKLSKVASLGFYRSGALKLAPAVCKITATDGSVLPCATIEFDSQRQAVKASTPAGLTVDVPLAKLAEVDYSQGKLVYLSDLEPLAVKWTPYIGLPPGVEYVQDYGLPRNDQAYSGEPLTLALPEEGGGERIETFRKGLALRSRTELVYRIPKGMERLAAVAGINPQTRGQGSVTVVVYADESIVWQGAIDGAAPPEAIEASLGEARRLRIVVDYGENLDYGDQLHLVEARVMK